ncbi:MAG TPA: DUF4382 domain-containing protein [Gammaproteobacteria bacterium]|jgi:hypothetical protein
MSRRSSYQAFALLGLLTVMVLSGCQNGFVGTVNLSIQAIPVPGVQNVFLAIKGVVLGGDGAPLDLPFASEEQVDIEAGRTPILAGQIVPVSGYQSVTIQIDPANSYVIAANGDRYPLDVASQYQSTGDFLVGEGLTVNLLVDVDLRTALSATTKDGVTVYTLEQNARFVDIDDTGNINGTVSTALMIGSLSVTDPDCVPAIYVYQGEGAVPEGFYVPVKGGTAPFASSSSFVLHSNQSLYTFSVTLLTPGKYTAAVTCTAADVPGSMSIEFSPTQDAVVTAGTGTDLTF